VSPTPLTIYELEQALVVHSTGIEGTGKVTFPLDVVHLCGPILEVVDDYVQFVHFTVQEQVVHLSVFLSVLTWFRYFLSSSIDNAIDSQEARVSLTASCLKYLCQHHHDADIDPDTRSQLILAGAFRLHHFARLFWLKLIKECRSNSTTDTLAGPLIDMLEALHNKRVNSAFEKAPKENRTEYWAFLEKMKKPKVYAMMNGSVSFRTSCSESAFTMRGSTSHSMLY
jgi:hypothetical protein